MVSFAGHHGIFVCCLLFFLVLPLLTLLSISWTLVSVC
uniref:Uncharacterized protein n=1 Tax=Anguilla anguilla TaxID=7936 RepID=A0A0E9PFL9_ANGAN